MTIKSSLLSAVASGLLVATMTGCGSSDNPVIVGGTTTNSGVQSSVQAVDGYIYNATAKAYYLAEDNATMKAVTLTSTPTTKDVVSGKVTLGSSTYSLPADTNSSVKSRIKFFEISNKASSTTGVTFTPAAYIEADGKVGYDANDTLLSNTTIYAPANSKIASPITSMIVAANKAIFGTPTTAPTSKVDLNATTFAQIEANATKIAKNLGLGDVNLLTADPVELAKTNPTFKLVTALLKGATANDAKLILKETPATNLAETLTIISKLKGNPKAATLATTLANLAKNGALSTAYIATMNIEKSVSYGKIASLTPPDTKGKFALNAITINDKNSSDFVAAGAKIQKDKLDVKFDMKNTDGNISNTAFKLVLALSGNKPYMALSDSNKSGAIVVEVPFEVNSTKTTSNILGVPTIAGGTLIKWEAKSSNGNEVVAKSDINASTLGITGVVTAANNVVSVNAKKLIDQIILAADDNLTGETGLKSSLGIGNLQIALVDSTGAIVSVSDDGKNSIPLAKTSIASMTGGISATEAIKVINLGTVDLRGSTTGANNAPSVLAISGTQTGSNAFLRATDNNASMGTNSKALRASGIKVIVNKGNGKTYLDFNVTSSDEGSETNTTVTISNLPTYITNNSKATLISPNNGGTVDFNLTIDSNASITKDTENVVKVSTKDEFGKTDSANDNNATFIFNVAPRFVIGKSVSTEYDINITGVTTPGVFTNLNGATSCTVNGTDLNNTSTSLLSASDINCTITLDGNLSLEINATGATDMNQTGWIDINVTDSYGATAEYNLTNVQDKSQ